ncbi:MAG: ORF6N domain-containing protein [Candidatus Aureabacteria bacterium]|nr:ORF6N domain-containing protein [Candidatus Auribacterota bacterium]
MDKAKKTSLIPANRIENVIILIRGQKVILDVELAYLYGVPTKRLNEQVKRNRTRFPEDFMFQLSRDEFVNLKSHFATTSSGWGGTRKPPYAFTEHGAIMAATVLNSPLAIEMSIFVVRAFVKLRRIIASHVELARKLKEMEKTYDAQFKVVFDAIRELMSPLEKPKRLIGFHAEP